MACVLTWDDMSAEGAGARAFKVMPFSPPGEEATGRGLGACPACPPLMSLSPSQSGAVGEGRCWIGSARRESGVAAGSEAEGDSGPPSPCPATQVGAAPLAPPPALPLKGRSGGAVRESKLSTR